MTKIVLLLLQLWTLAYGVKDAKVQRSFYIDYENNTFAMDGKPFRYISGSMHYMRVPRELWMDRLRKIRAAGFNALQFYIQWNLHESKPGHFTYEGNLDFFTYMDMAKRLGLYVILRPGPYICGERDGGGLPYWLYRIDPTMKLRSKDPTYLKYVDLWWFDLLPKIKPYLYENGGPVIMVQLENEYGSYGRVTGYCDIEYMTHLKNLARHYLGENLVLFTTDGDVIEDVACGKVPGAYATIDFGPGTNVPRAFHVQRLFEPKGPLVNSEYYPGWLDYWGQPHNKVSVERSIKTFKEMLEMGANVNVYMVHGGTSFGFESGANTPPFEVEPTSYDYDALISEAGDLTEKYFAFKKIISEYLPIPAMEVSNGTIKEAYGKVHMRFVSTIFEAKDVVVKYRMTSESPKTFEDLDQASGFVLYETKIKRLFTDPANLVLTKLHDRAYIYINFKFVGILSRGEQCLSLPISVRIADALQILVENQGRIGYGAYAEDFKGITKNVTLSGVLLTNWTMFSMPLDDGKIIEKFADEIWKQQNYDQNLALSIYRNLMLTQGSGTFWTGELHVTCGEEENRVEDSFVNKSRRPRDTFLSLPGWSKGVVFVNGFNLGRYWPVMGPQITLYLPGPKLRCGKNKIIVLELERPNCGTEEFINCFVQFVKDPEIDGPTPVHSSVEKQQFNRKTHIIMNEL